ncbi:hypothetical protein SVIOM342S_00870 [Streptomyces violaceorubidus]
MSRWTVRSAGVAAPERSLTCTVSEYRSSSLTSPNAVCARVFPLASAATICPPVVPTGALDPSPVTVVAAVPCAGAVREVSARVATPWGAPRTDSFNSTAASEELVYVTVLVTGSLTRTARSGSPGRRCRWR